MAAQRQVNVRLDVDEFEALDTCAFLERRSVPEELRAVVRAHIAAFEGRTSFKEATAARASRDEETGKAKSTVTSLDAKRGNARHGGGT